MRDLTSRRGLRLRAATSAGVVAAGLIGVGGCWSSSTNTGPEGDFPPNFAQTLEKANPNIFKRKVGKKHYDDVSLGDRFLIMKREAAKLKEQSQ